MVPTVELPPCTPFTLQVALTGRALFMAVNCCVAPKATVAELGDTVRVGGGGGGLPLPPHEIKTERSRKTRPSRSIVFIF